MKASGSRGIRLDWSSWMRVERPGFLWRQGEVGKALAGAHLSGAQDEVVGVDLADSVAVLGEIEFDGGRGEPLFESADLGLADTA